MAEMKRALARCRTRENGPISLSAKAVLYHLWTYVDKDEAIAYWAGKRGRPRVLLHKKLEGVAPELDISLKQLRRHMQLLASELLIGWHGGDWFEVISIPERDRLLGRTPRLDPEVKQAVNTGSDGSADRSVPSGRDIHVPDPGQMCLEPGTSMSQIRDTSVPRSLVGSDRDQIGIGSGSRARARAAGTPDFREIALEIVLLAPQPPGLPALPATEDGIRDLVALLAAGWRRDQVAAVLQAAPAILAASPEKARFYGPHMFQRQVWWPWCQDVEALKVNRPTPQVVEPTSAVTTDPEAEEQARREADERRLLRRVLAAIEQPPAPNDFDRQTWRLHPRWLAALMFAPDEAQRAGRAVIADAQAERRDATVGELTRALNAIEFRDPSIPDEVDDDEQLDEPSEATDADVLDELRALRVRAEAEGRKPTWEELQAVGQKGERP